MPSGSSQRRAQGGGRTPNSEPRLQVFKDFSGINFEHENHLFGGVQVDYGRKDPGDQTDLQMNFMFLQNNVSVVSNKTLETRDNIVTLFDSCDEGGDLTFTGPVKLIGPKLYAAMSDESIAVGDLRSIPDDRVIRDFVTITDMNPDEEQPYPGYESPVHHHLWSEFEYYDDKLIALTRKATAQEIASDPSYETAVNEIWTGDISDFTATEVRNARLIENPEYNLNDNECMKPMGDLQYSMSFANDRPFRTVIAYTLVGKYGPTMVGNSATTIWTNHPVSEWGANCYLQLAVRIPGWKILDEEIKAIEFYYSADNASDMLFFGRYDLETYLKDRGVEDMTPEELEQFRSGVQYCGPYNWFGYVNTTEMWTIGNLTVPSENYTRGVSASRVCSIDGRLYFWGDESQPQRLYIGGNPGNLFSVSPGTGGGFVDVEPGTRQAVRHVCKYKTQSGNSIVTMLCDSPNTRREQRFNLVENSISLSNEQSMKSWQAEQVAGAIGCKSYDGAVVCEDGLYSVSRYGLALTTMTMEYNSQIRTNYVSDPIKTVFTDVVNRDTRLSKAMILELDGVIYIALGGSRADYMDNVIFCYDIDLKAWWTYTLDVEDEILKIFHVDYEDSREGIGIVTARHIYLLPTTDSDWETIPSDHKFLIETAELSTQMPQQSWQYLSQLEFHFDYFVGDMTIHMHAFDMFGRKLDIVKRVHETNEHFNYVVHMRIDQRLMSYVLIMDGTARFRMTHFIARVYTLSNKIGQVWGFDDSISIRQSGDEQTGHLNNRIHPTFKCYNDIRKAIFT